MAAHAYHPHCGCAGCGQVEADDERRDDYIDATVAAYAKDPAKLRTAEEWTAGTFSGEHCADVTLALYELHNTPPDQLAGSDLLARLYALAKVEGAAITEQLKTMAAADYDKDIAA